MIQFLVPQKQSGGVYDFSCKLQEAIGQDEVILVHLSKENAADWKVGSGDSVILQMSGYGFARRGAPLWLLHELENRRKSIKTLGIFFHELYAFGPPWTSSFWLSPVQRYISRRLVELSDFWMTSPEGSAQWLRQYAGDKPHAVLPVFSNVGESGLLTQVRLPRIVVFGSPGLRQMTYQAAGGKLFAWAKKASLEIHDIGAPMPDVRLDETLHLNGVVQHGRMDDHEIMNLMGNALFGLLTYPVEYVAKSGVFAAYCAHGVCPVLIWERYGEADGLTAAQHYLPGISDNPVSPAKVAAVSEAARSWYQSHSIGAHAATLLRLVNSGVGQP